MYRQQPHRAYCLVTLTLMALILVGCGAAAPPAATPVVATIGEATQTNEGGQVTVTATWAGTAVGPAFAVVLDTHSVDLDEIDLSALATLTADGIRVRPIMWDAPAGGHHREGLLSFPATADDGTPVIRPETTRIELVIRDVAGVPERTFHWNVSP